MKGSTLSITVNGKQLHSEPLPANADPWLAIRTHQLDNAGAIKNVQILGTPTIPREIKLTAAVDLSGWRAEYYAQAIGKEGSHWTKTGDEIAGRLIPNAPGSFREGLLQYHRPLLEDGELEYEFFYEPGKTELHPALDRLVFLLAPDGVMAHWLTDAQHDRTGLAPDNVTPLANSKPLSLKAGDWNKLLLTLAGDEVTLAVNGQEAARYTLDKSNQRTLGLFHYRDATAARFRNVVHRGKWPTELPPLEKQELAN